MISLSEGRCRRLPPADWDITFDRVSSMHWRWTQATPYRSHCRQAPCESLTGRVEIRCYYRKHPDAALRPLQSIRWIDLEHHVKKFTSTHAFRQTGQSGWVASGVDESFEKSIISESSKLKVASAAAWVFISIDCKSMWPGESLPYWWLPIHRMKSNAAPFKPVEYIFPEEVLPDKTYAEDLQVIQRLIFLQWSCIGNKAQASRSNVYSEDSGGRLCQVGFEVKWTEWTIFPGD